VKSPRAVLLAVAKVSKKQDRSDDVTGQRRQNDGNSRNKKSADNQGSHRKIGVESDWVWILWPPSVRLRSRANGELRAPQQPFRRAM
jgi:hypothetical protein